MLVRLGEISVGKPTVFYGSRSQAGPRCYRVSRLDFEGKWLLQALTGTAKKPRVVGSN